MTARKKKSKKKGVVIIILQEAGAWLPVVMLMVLGSGLIFGKGMSVKEKTIKNTVMEKPYSTLAHWQMAKWAAETGDNSLAKKEFGLGEMLTRNQRVLGASTLVEEEIWPEIKVEREIEKLEEYTKFNLSREVLIKLSNLYRIKGDKDRTEYYLGEAKMVDPNDKEFK